MNIHNTFSAGLLSVILVSGVIPLAGCGNNAISGKGSDTIRPNSAEERLLTDETNDDMRLGLDRYKGNRSTFPDSDGDAARGLNRENGIGGWDQDDSNRWSDYQAGGPSTSGAPHGAMMNRGGESLHNNTRLETRGDLVQAIEMVPGVRHASVLMGDRHIYVAVFTDYGSDQRNLTPELRDRISMEIRRLAPGVERVFVSENAELFRRSDGLANVPSEQRAATVQGFNQFLERLFPTASGPNHTK